MDLRVSTRTIGDRYVIALDGVADLASVPRLQSELRRRVMHLPGHTILVDVDGLAALDDVALGVLLGVAATARELGGDLEVVASSARWRERFATTRFEHAVTVRSSVV
jgi:anti-sigma B factor antagonist